MGLVEDATNVTLSPVNKTVLPSARAQGSAATSCRNLTYKYVGHYPAHVTEALESRLIRPAHAAEILHVSGTSLRRLLDTGDLHSYASPDGHPQYDLVEVLAYAARLSAAHPPAVSGWQLAPVSCPGSCGPPSGAGSSSPPTADQSVT